MQLKTSDQLSTHVHRLDRALYRVRHHYGDLREVLEGTDDRKWALVLESTHDEVQKPERERKEHRVQ